MSKIRQDKKFSSATFRSQAESESLGTPALIIAAEKAVQNMLTGPHSLRRPGIGEKFWQFREYISSDKPQDIDWKQSGKSDSVFVREKEKQTNQTTYIWCQDDAGMRFRSSKDGFSKSDTAKILSLSLCLMITKAHDRVGIIGSQQRAGRTESTLQILAETLTKDSFPSLNQVAENNIPNNSNLVLIGDFLDTIEDIQRSISTLKTQSSRSMIIQVLDAAEINLPYQGRTIFQHPISGDKEIIQNVDPIRQEYAQRIDAHIHSLKTYCHSNGWEYLLHRTDKPISETLFHIWSKLSERPDHGSY